MHNQRIYMDRVTYGQLSHGLSELGFKRRRIDGLVAFHEPIHDALIVIPYKPSRTFVGDPHLVAIKNTVVGRGVATAEQLKAVLFRTPRRWFGNKPAFNWPHAW